MPFKVHRGKQPYDAVYNYLLQPQTAGDDWLLDHFRLGPLAAPAQKPSACPTAAAMASPKRRCTGPWPIWSHLKKIHCSAFPATGRTGVSTGWPWATRVTPLPGAADSIQNLREGGKIMLSYPSSPKTHPLRHNLAQRSPARRSLSLVCALGCGCAVCSRPERLPTAAGPPAAGLSHASGFSPPGQLRVRTC
jgi:hypothetical protein